jgi:rhamnose transport system permease protein
MVAAGQVRWFAVARWLPLVLPVLVLGVMLPLNPVLAEADAWDRMARNWTGVALLALGMTPIIITGGIDLSVGSVVGLAAVVVGYLWRVVGLPVEVALLGGVLTGLACGSVNGVLVLAGINPLVVTLATLGAFRGLAYGISGARPVGRFPQYLNDWWDQGTVLGLPNPLWLFLILFVALYLLLHHTWMGRMLFAIGDNPQAARYAGVPTRSLTFGLYAANGLLAGAVGATTILKSLAAPARQGENLELTAIACVVLGGTRITGGSGHLAGTVLGTLTLMLLLEGLAGMLGEWRQLATGAFLVAVAIANEAVARWLTRHAAGTPTRGAAAQSA